MDVLVAGIVMGLFMLGAGVVWYRSEAQAARRALQAAKQCTVADGTGRAIVDPIGARRPNRTRESVS